MKRFVVLFLILLFQYSLPYALSANSTIKVGVYNNEPLLFANADGKGKGVFADIIEHVASKEGWQIEYVTGTWDQCLSRLENNQIDILGTIAFTKARDKLYDFGKENLMTNWGQLYTPAGSDIKVITDVAGKKVAVLKGDIHYRVFAQIIERFGIECEFIETDNYRSALDLVSRNQADAGIVNRFFGMKYESKYKLDKSGVIFNPIKLYYAVPEGRNSEIIDTIDRYIVSLKGNENSEYYRSLDRWFEAVSAKRAFPQWAKWVILVSLGLVIFLFLGNLVLRIQVKRKTKEILAGREALLDSQRELNIRNKITNIFLTVPDEEMYGEVLQVVLEAMKSKYGIFGYIDENGALVAPSMTRDIWDQCRVPDKKLVYPREKWSGIWGRALVEKKTLFSNEPFEVPEGHLPISCAVVVPIIDHGESIGTLEVANKPKGYDYKDIQSLEMIADHIAPILNARLQRDKRERESHRAEEALRESEERLARAIEGNSIPTLLIDGNHILTHWNKSCENLTGISAAEIVGTRKAWSALYAEERPLLADLIVDEITEKEIAGYYDDKYNKSILTEGAYECEDFYSDLGEKGKWLFFTAAPLRNQQGKIVGAIETFQDITERRNMEEQLRQSQKMEAIGTLAGGIAHDFNNLLTVIIGNAQLALMDVTKDESLRKGIEEIEKAGDKAASLTRQLLAFSRKQVIMPEVIDLNKGINETKNMLKRTIGEDIKILTILEPELGKVYADFGQIDQVIMNLAVNARDAMPQGGELTIETDNADLDKNYFRERGIHEETPGHYVMLSVSDTGSGMDKETREHIFEPFFTTKEVGKGTGLGLSTIYGIVKQNNGFVWVYSEPGQGSTFKVYLPEVKGDAEPKEKEQSPVDDPGGSETVLIVEDDYGLRKFAQEVLQSYGYRTFVAENGEDALRVSKEYEGPIHLLLTDVVMPKMGGREAAKRLQPLYPRMKVIYMSGYTDNAIVHHGVLEPGLNFLEKPFTPKGLARKVRGALDRESEK